MRVARHPDGVETEAGARVVYDVERDEAHFGAARVEGHALVWELVERPAQPQTDRSATASDLSLQQSQFVQHR